DGADGRGRDPRPRGAPRRAARPHGDPRGGDRPTSRRQMRTSTNETLLRKVNSPADPLPPMITRKLPSGRRDTVSAAGSVDEIAVPIAVPPGLPTKWTSMAGFPLTVESFLTSSVPPVQLNVAPNRELSFE